MKGRTSGLAKSYRYNICMSGKRSNIIIDSRRSEARLGLGGFQVKLLPSRSERQSRLHKICSLSLTLACALVSPRSIVVLFELVWVSSTRVHSGPRTPSRWKWTCSYEHRSAANEASCPIGQVRIPVKFRKYSPPKQLNTALIWLKQWKYQLRPASRYSPR